MMSNRLSVDLEGAYQKKGPEWLREEIEASLREISRQSGDNVVNWLNREGRRLNSLLVVFATFQGETIVSNLHVLLVVSGLRTQTALQKKIPNMSRSLMTTFFNGAVLKEKSRKGSWNHQNLTMFAEAFGIHPSVLLFEDLQAGFQDFLQDLSNEAKKK